MGACSQASGDLTLDLIEQDFKRSGKLKTTNSANPSSHDVSSAHSNDPISAIAMPARLTSHMHATGMNYLLFPSSPLEAPAKTSASREGGQDLLARSPRSSSRPSGSSGKCANPRPIPTRALLCGRMSQELFPLTLDEISRQSSVRWRTAGLWRSRGGLSMLDGSESPNAAVECSLSRILEANPHPRYFLSPKACAGILRRCEKRKRTLPEPLRSALRSHILTQPKTPSSSPPCIVANEEFHRVRKHAVVRSSVRRLTPLECERLMGFPDGWTYIHAQTLPAIESLAMRLCRRSRSGLRGESERS